MAATLFTFKVTATRVRSDGAAGCFPCLLQRCPAAAICISGWRRAWQARASVCPRVILACPFAQSAHSAGVKPVNWRFGAGFLAGDAFGATRKFRGKRSADLRDKRAMLEGHARISWQAQHFGAHRFLGRRHNLKGRT